jgi:hypothetical protein
VSKHRGVSWDSNKPVTEENFKPLLANKVNWIAQVPEAYQKKHNQPEIFFVTGGGWWSETDHGIITTTKIARKFGIKTLLKPQVSAAGRRSNIAMENEADWKKWFENYAQFILHHARLAEKYQIEALAIGTELYKTVYRREDWQDLIKKIRKVYHGKLTFAANWHKEFEAIEFWDSLDFIGIQAYFPLTDKESPTVSELKKGWRPHLLKIEQIQRKYDRPVIFTELGYRSTKDAAIAPWVWPQFKIMKAKIDIDVQTQANAFQAFFEIFWDKPWFGGCYIWKWQADHQRAGGPKDFTFTPQNKPAERIIKEWYSKTSQ